MARIDLMAATRTARGRAPAREAQMASVAELMTDTADELDRAVAALLPQRLAEARHADR